MFPKFCSEHLSRTFSAIRVLFSCCGREDGNISISGNFLYECKFPLQKEDLWSGFRVFLLSVIFNLKINHMLKRHAVLGGIFKYPSILCLFPLYLHTRKHDHYNIYLLAQCLRSKLDFQELGLYSQVVWALWYCSNHGNREDTCKY